MKDSIIKNKLLHKILIYLFSIFVLYIFVLLLSKSFDNEIVLPNPNDMINKFFILLGSSKTYNYILNTILNLIISLIISFIIGLVFGVLAGIYKYIRYFFKPWITIMRSLPLASIIILIMLLVELENTPYIVCCLVLIPIIYEGISNAIMSISKEYLDVYKLESNVNIKVIYKVYLPLIFSSIRASFITSIGLGLKVLIMAEFIVGAKDTLGYAIHPVIENIDYASGYAYCMIIVIVVLIVEMLPNLIYKLYNYIKFR